MLNSRFIQTILAVIFVGFCIIEPLEAQRSGERTKSGRTKKVAQEEVKEEAEDTKKQSGRQSRGGKKSGRTSRGSRSSEKSARVFEMDESVSSGDLIGSWDITEACVYESGFTGDPLCATDEDIKDFVENISLYVGDDGTGFLDVEGEREELTWEEDENGFRVDIGDDDFGLFSLFDDGLLTIADDFGSGCYDVDDEEIADVGDESDCSESGGAWEEAASMVYTFERLADGELAESTDSRLQSNRSWWSKIKRKAKKAARKAAERARKTAQAAAEAAAEQAAEIAEAAAELALEAYEELLKEAEALAKEMSLSQINKLQESIVLTGPLMECLSTSEALVEIALAQTSGETPDFYLFIDLLNECDSFNDMLISLDNAGMKGVFLGVAASATSPYIGGVTGGVTFAISIKDLRNAWDDIKNNIEPSVPDMAIQYVLGRSYGTDSGVDAGIIFGWNTVQPQNSYGKFWEIGVDIDAYSRNVESSTALTIPTIDILEMKISGLEYLGQTFAFGNATSSNFSLNVVVGECCITHVNTMTSRCD